MSTFKDSSPSKSKTKLSPETSIFVFGPKKPISTLLNTQGDKLKWRVTYCMLTLFVGKFSGKEYWGRK